MSDHLSRIKAKIQKLKAMANDPAGNVHQAAAAAAAATRLMLEHEIDEAELGDGAPEEEQITDTDLLEVLGLSRPADWHLMLGQGLGQAHSCKVYREIRKARKGRGRGDMRLAVFGRPEDVATVSYLFAFCTKEINRLCEEHFANDLTRHMTIARGLLTRGVTGRRGTDAEFYAEMSKESRSMRAAFRYGAASAIAMKAMQEREAVLKAARARGQERGLVRVEGVLARIDEHIAQIGELKKETKEVKVGNMDAYYDGLRAGQKIPLRAQGPELGAGQERRAPRALPEGGGR